MRSIEPQKLSVVLGFAAMLFLPLTLGSGVDLASDTDGPLVRTADVCAQSYICGYAPEKPPCPDDPYAECDAGCEDDDDRCLVGC
jgi:hypothetical protein